MQPLSFSAKPFRRNKLLEEGRGYGLKEGWKGVVVDEDDATGGAPAWTGRDEHEGSRKVGKEQVKDTSRSNKGCDETKVSEGRCGFRSSKVD